MENFFVLGERKKKKLKSIFPAAEMGGAIISVIRAKQRNNRGSPVSEIWIFRRGAVIQI